jgi:hypothetical protein
MKVQKKTNFNVYTKSCLYIKDKKYIYIYIYIYIYCLCFLFIKIVQNYEEPLDLY